MSTENDDLMVYDEDNAVKYILNLVPEEFRKSIDETKAIIPWWFLRVILFNFSIGTY